MSDQTTLHRRLATRHLIGLTVLAGSLVAAAAAQAQSSARPPSGFYVRLDAGASISANTNGNVLNGTGFGQDFGTSAVVGAGFGYAFPWDNTPVRVRLDVTGSDRPSLDSSHSASSGPFTLGARTSINSAVLMGTAYADWATGSAFTPYLSGGLGVAINSLDTVRYSFNGVPAATEGGTTQTNFAWSVGFGVSYPLGGSLAIDAGYRYLDAGDVKSSGTIQVFGRPGTNQQAPVKSDLSAHELTLGLRYNF